MGAIAEGPFKIEFPGSRIYGKITYVRTLTAGDVRRLANCFRTNALLKIYDIFGSTLSGIDHRQLTMQDWMFLLLWQRINSYPYFPIIVEWTCSHCGFNNSTKITSENFIIEPLDPNYDHSGVPVFFPSLNRNLHLRLSIVDDDIFAHEYVMKTKGVSNPSLEDIEPIMMSCMITDKDLVFAEKLSIVEKMSIEDYFKFKAFDQVYNYGVKDSLKVKCAKCSETSEVKYEFRITEFFPQNTDREYLRTLLSARANSQSTDSTVRGDRSFPANMDATKVQRATQGKGEEEEFEFIDFTKVQ